MRTYRILFRCWETDLQWLYSAMVRYRVLALISSILLHECGYHVLRFNSRGVGKSSGWPSFTGLTEGENLEELVQWGLGAVTNVKSVVLIVRTVVISFVNEVSLYMASRATRMELSYHPSIQFFPHQFKLHTCYSHILSVPGPS